MEETQRTIAILFSSTESLEPLVFEKSRDWRGPHGDEPRDDKEAAFGRLSYTAGYRDAFSAARSALMNIAVSSGDGWVTFSIPPTPSLCPLRVQSSLEAYVRGLPPGDFIRAVLCNDLNEAISRADDVNIHALAHIVAYVREHLPAISWGSSEKVNRWLSKAGDSTRPTDKACIRCGLLTAWQGPDGKFYCWPACSVAKSIDDGSAAYGPNGEIVETEREG